MLASFSLSTGVSLHIGALFPKDTEQCETSLPHIADHLLPILTQWVRRHGHSDPDIAPSTKEKTTPITAAMCDSLSSEAIWWRNFTHTVFGYTALANMFTRWVMRRRFPGKAFWAGFTKEINSFCTIRK